MAITKSATSVVSTTSAGTGTAIDVSANYGSTLFWAFTENGTRTVAATMLVEESPDAGTTWYKSALIVGGPLTSTTNSNKYPLDPTTTKVRLTFAVGTGGTSTISTLATQIGQITGI